MWNSDKCWFGSSPLLPWNVGNWWISPDFSSKVAPSASGGKTMHAGCLVISGAVSSLKVRSKYTLGDIVELEFRSESESANGSSLKSFLCASDLRKVRSISGSNCTQSWLVARVFTKK